MTNSTNHHPDENMLIEFSAGTLATAPSICVSAHLHFCSSCRTKLLRLDQVGSQMMSQTDPMKVEDNAFDKLMEKIDSAEKVIPKEKTTSANMPFSVNKLINTSLISKNWKRLSSSVDVARFKTGQDDFEVALHKICAGGKTPKHGHEGLEYTVV